LQALEESGRSFHSLFSSKDTLSTEEEAYRYLNLPWIPPELREGHREIELAASGELPTLVTVDDICGELHAHSTSSDGKDSIEAMANEAMQRGYVYLGITDHSQSLKIAGGVSEEALWLQIKVIDRINLGLKGITVLKSAEVDILADGSLDYPDELLSELDYTVCSIHSRFGLNRKQQTERILRAMDNPYFTILGHATGRKLLKRSGYETDLDRIIAHAKARGCFFEINSSPQRLDLSAENARRVAEADIPIAICTDAHTTAELGFIRHGIEQARRAGLTKKQVLNAMPLAQLKKRFSRH
jgi:DNA polymerase (family 10)